MFITGCTKNCHFDTFFRDHCVYKLGKWDKVLHSKASSHWSTPHPEWSLLPWQLVQKIAENFINILISHFQLNYINFGLYSCLLSRQRRHLMKLPIWALIHQNICLFATTPLPEPMLDPWEQTSMKFESNYIFFSFKKFHLKMSSAKCWPFCWGCSLLTLKGLG